MKFSLINVRNQKGDRVDGSWIQDHIGTLQSATVAARETEAANSNNITVAVVGYGGPGQWRMVYYSKRLDK